MKNLLNSSLIKLLLRKSDKGNRYRAKVSDVRERHGILSDNARSVELSGKEIAGDISVIYL